MPRRVSITKCNILYPIVLHGFIVLAMEHFRSGIRFMILAPALATRLECLLEMEC